MDKDYVSIRRLGRFLTQLKGLFVQEVSGKGLSTEDYTTEEKTKLAGIASGAEVNVIEGVQVNGADLTPDANRKVNVVVPENVAHKVSGATSGNFAALNAQGDLTDSGKDASDFGSAADVEAINEKIPTQASESNQLADKNFVNSSIQTETATFRGIMDCWCALGALGSAPDNNDYAVLKRCNDYIYKFVDDPDEPHNIGDIFGYGGIVYRVVTDFQGSFDETKCEKIGEFALYGGEEPDYGMGVQRYYSYSIEGKTYFRIADWDVENPDGLSPSDPSWIPANWVLIEETHWSVDTPLATWRWKYTRPSGSGVYAWEAEYKINDAPLTAAQIAALNSNITEALTNKLVALPAKPVDTAAQTLSDAEKLQARTNIGATAPEVFWAVYGTTTFVAITAAVDAGKVVLCAYSNRVYILATKDAGSANLVAVNGVTAYRITCEANNDWDAYTFTYQQAANLVTSWRVTPDNNHYPAEKLVKDSLDAITPFIGTYNSTTFAEISAALTAGKEVWINRNGKLYQYSNGIGQEYSYYLAPDMEGTGWLRLKNATNDWAANTNTFQNVSSKVTSLSASSTDNQYPSAKAVYDELQGRQPLIDSSHKLDYSLLDNTPTIPSAPVNMTGATASAAGSAGYAPAPAAGDNEKFLRGDGTWQEAGGGSDAALDKIVEGQAGIPEFDATETYLAGHYVLYNEYVWRFTQNHNPGAWTGNDAVQTSVINELEGLLIGDTEVVNVVISSSDGQLTVSGITVSLTFDDGSPTVTATTNASGLAGFNVAKGKVYNVIVPSQTGYQTPSPVKVLANSNERYVNMVYSVAYSGIATVTVTFSVYKFASVAEFVGKNASIILSNDDSITATIDSNGVATFANVPQGLSGFVITPYIAGYSNPSRINFNVNSSSVGLNAVYHIQQAGIYMALNDGTEVTFDSFDAQTDTCVALHIATADLLAAGCDYYVPIEEFTAAWFDNTNTKAWSTQNVLYPNVPNYTASDYDGKSATALMLSDADTLRATYPNISAPAAEYATSFTFTFNGNTMNGFLGNRSQFQVLVDNYSGISSMVTAAGYTPSWYGNRGILTSSQNGGSESWRWTGANWQAIWKASSYAVMPFFSL